jgi:hypothetical protein
LIYRTSSVGGKKKFNLLEEKVELFLLKEMMKDAKRRRRKKGDCISALFLYDSHLIPSIKNKKSLMCSAANESSLSELGLVQARLMKI